MWTLQKISLSCNMMKPLKYIVLATMLFLTFSCGSDPSEETPTDETETGKPATRLIFSENVAQRIGIIDLKEPGSFKTLLDYEHNELGVPGGVAVNQVSKRLYITEQDGARIFRINLDSTLFKLVYDSDDGLSLPTAIAVDTVSKKIYWADSGTGQIMTGDLFGSVAPEALFDGAAVIQYCYGIAIDHTNNKIYFSDNNLHQISVGNLNGTGTPTILYDDNNTVNLGCPSSLVFSDNKLYWADDCFSNILVANADGSGDPTALFGEEDGISFADGLAIDKASKKIYWSETDGYRISRGNLDGSGDPEIILESVQAYSIALEF
jgi:sugar lactone lactonase YvrE